MERSKKIPVIPIFIFFVSAALLSGCSLFDRLKAQKLPVQDVVLKTASEEIALTVEIADSAEERKTGLMYRDELDKGRGMLFIFPESAPRNFWMKNTEMALDVIFLNSEKEVISFVENMEPCGIEDDAPAACALFSSKRPAMYALEVASGFIKEKGVKVGDKLIY